MSLAIRKNLTPDPEPVEEEKKKFSMKGFSLKKMLQKPKKKKGKVTDLADLPQLRTEDSHPDAPARRPIFAESDLGSPLQEKIKQFEEQPEAPVVEASPEMSEQAAPQVQPAEFVADKALHVEEAQAQLLNDVPTEAPAPVSTDLNASIAPPVVEAPAVLAQPAEGTAPFANPNGPSSVSAAPVVQEPVEPAMPETPGGPAPFAQPQNAPTAAEPAPVAQEAVPAVEQPAPAMEAAPAPAPVEEPKEDLSGLSIAELADRLESGLSRLKELQRASETVADVASVAAEAPAVPANEQPSGGISVSSNEEPMQVPPLKPVEPSAEEVQAARQADMDAALKAALGTLEKMTAQR